MACDLILLHEGKQEGQFDTPNLRLVKYCKDVHIEFCQPELAHDFIDEYQDRQRSMGCHFYWIPGGGHTALAAKGYFDAAIEIMEQMKDIKVDVIFLPCGTGTTQAGLAGLNKRIPVFGVSVARSVERCEKEIAVLLEEIGSNIQRDYIHVLASDIKYGEKNTELDEMIATLLKSDGVFLDPIYNAKSFLKMTHYLRSHPEIKTAV